jgi:hypothetical protein
MHELKSLTLEQGSAGLTPKRFDFIKKLLEDCKGFRHILHLAFRFPGGPNPAVSFTTILELVAFWPQLRSLEVHCGGSYYMNQTLTLDNFKKLARKPSLENSGVVRYVARFDPPLSRAVLTCKIAKFTTSSPA